MRVRVLGRDGWPLRWQQPPPAGGLADGLVLLSADVLEPGRHLVEPRAGKISLRQNVELHPGVNRFQIHLEADGTIIGWGPR